MNKAFGRIYQYRVKKNVPIRRFPTDCCALGQLSINNNHTVEEIKAVVDNVKSETAKKWNTYNRDGGERAVFVITTPFELELEHKLADVGFEKVCEFNRRNGYPAGILKMWVISW